MGFSDPLGIRQSPGVRAGMRATPRPIAGGEFDTPVTCAWGSRKVAGKSPGFVVRPAVDHAGDMDDGNDAQGQGLCPAAPLTAFRYCG